MTQKGCPDIRIMKNPTLHAKIILVDKTQWFVGSFNFTKNSLENNRELGIFVYWKSVEYIVNKFQSDWENSIAF
jgi:phosphatidylserine/phosphatidylglycerophosphate/cardiolipin synthase-like enzyme